MNDDRLIQLLSAANPVDEESLPGAPDSLVEEIFAGTRRPRRPLRRPLAAALAALVAAAAGLASPPGQGALRSVVEQVRSVLGGEGAVVGGEGTVRPLDADGIVTSAVPDGRGGWFLAGGFTKLNGEPRAHLAHVLPDGSVDPDWTPELGGPQPAHYIGATLARAGGRLYVAGQFATINGEHRGQVVALDTATGKVAPGWRVFVNTQGSAIQAVVARAGRVWLGLEGHALIQGEVLRCVAALDGVTGALDRGFRAELDWVGGLPCVKALAGSPERLYAAGIFTARDGSRQGIAALDLETGRLVEGFEPPPPPCPVCPVTALALSGDRLYAGSNSLVALDAETGSRRHFPVTISRGKDERSGGWVVNLAALGDDVYLGGDFREVNGEPRNGFAVLDREGNLRESWQPASTTESILALAVSGRDVLAAGARSRDS